MERCIEDLTHPIPLGPPAQYCPLASSPNDNEHPRIHRRASRASPSPPCRPPIPSQRKCYVIPTTHTTPHLLYLSWAEVPAQSAVPFCP